MTIRQVAYLRTEAGGDVESLITRHVYNTAGQLTEQWDARLPTPHTRHIHSLSGKTVQIASVDSGSRVSLFGLAGEVLRHWDLRGNHWRNTYDDQLRPLSMEENGQPDVDTFTYADASADSAHNLRGQLIRQVDVSGAIEFNSFNLQGQSLAERRTIADSGTFVSHRTYSALGALLTQTDAGEHQQHLRYDIAGQLNRVMLQLKNGQPQSVLQDAQYNAAGQIEVQIAGNGVCSQWTYDPADGRLCTLKSGKPQQALQQDLQYSYDRMGNILRIEDHTLPTVYFANQRVEGLREYAYDSLYRLISANGFEAEVPHLQPGLPELVHPIDPGRRYGYREHYTYDAGNNLVKLCHQRDGNHFTLHLRIDPGSNRGVRLKPGDPEPEFDKCFDPNGNQLYLQDGAQPLSWNARDQLAKVTLLSHSNGLADDEETYLYSQGERVCKRHITHTPSLTHSHEILYLPGLDIHTRDDGRVLHVITLPLAFGSVRCLHWDKGLPLDLEPDQLRYGLDDHLGSCTRELDRHGALISLEFYYPFGGTAWWAARSEVEADYKTIRYSGKEMDRCGLYYYGARYYAPWLWRWICPDPAGDVDGLNLYVFVGNNPVCFVDINGEIKLPTVADFNAAMDRLITSENASYARRRQSRAVHHLKSQIASDVLRQINILGLTQRRTQDASQQLETMGSGSAVALSTARRTGVLVAGKALSYGAGILVGLGAQALGVAAPGVGNAVGVAIGLSAKIAVSAAVDFVAERTGLSASVNLKTSKLTADKIIKKAEYKTMELTDYIAAKYRNMNLSSQKSQLKLTKEATTMAASEILKATLAHMPSEAVSAMSSGVGIAMGIPEIVNETRGALRGKSDEKMDQFEQGIIELQGAITSGMNNIIEKANALSITQIGGIEIEALKDKTNESVGLLGDLLQKVRAHGKGHRVAA
ncbi:RHS repeat domain-containing protein [Pseudomonas sp. FP1742]|uniref:RHS repeat domain-containing protein n=1 Tax=Pseudomonas sp. FP1742 TaxID=2954079 RepID=UPI002736688D|nr:RHS repeat-associated core domain-containing protein [Pseudomonas sp. FP1742]WLG49726.1 toxin [Pseudomonas sp. FP1742]